VEVNPTVEASVTGAIGAAMTLIATLAILAASPATVPCSITAASLRSCASITFKLSSPLMVVGTETKFLQNFTKNQYFKYFKIFSYLTIILANNISILFSPFYFINRIIINSL
jgi:hypothetical protein